MIKPGDMVRVKVCCDTFRELPLMWPQTKARGWIRVEKIEGAFLRDDRGYGWYLSRFEELD